MKLFLENLHKQVFGCCVIIFNAPLFTNTMYFDLLRFSLYLILKYSVIVKLLVESISQKRITISLCDDEQEN